MDKFKLKTKLEEIVKSIDKETELVCKEKQKASQGSDDYTILEVKEAHLQELANRIWEAINELDWFTCE
ncbi:MAG: hypothetical protein M0R51_10885 [Clostridia bacterium]|jgi:hypothetical protein|nr:hypothetical protein [Clostridia bacterium]